METKNLLTLTITLVVGIILAGSLMMPVINDATATEDTFTNDGYFRMSKLSDADSGYVMTWTPSDNHYVTVGDESVEIPWNTDYPVSIIAIENYGVRYTIVSQSQGTVALDLFGPQASVIASRSVDTEITLSEGTMTLKSTGSSDISISYTTAYVLDPNGAYIMKKSSEAAYVHGDSDIFATGRTNTTFGNLNINVSGTIDDGFVADVFSDESVSASNYVVSSTTKTNYKDLYTFTGVSFDLTKNDSTTTASYSQVIVPYQVTAELSQHLAPGEIAILNALPILIITALVVMAAGALYLKRDD